MSVFRGRRSLRALFLVVAAGAVAAVVLAGTGAFAATTGGCLLAGKATLTPGLTSKAQATSYTFTGTFSQCKGTGTVKSGSVTASGSGTSSCTANTTSGTASVTWNTGQTSTISFTTKGTGTLVQVAGTFTGGLFAGSKASAKLLFYTTTPQKCNTAGGLTSASFEGPSTIGI